MEAGKNLWQRAEFAEQVRQAVERAEATTTGEIVPVLIPTSDIYPVAHYRSAIAVAMLLVMAAMNAPTSVLVQVSTLPMAEAHAPEAVLLVLAVGIGLLLGYVLPFAAPLKKFFCTSLELKVEVHERASQAFFGHRLHSTTDHNGVLVFISMLERRIEILTDHGAAEKIPPAVWDKLILELGPVLRSGHFGQALLVAIERTGALLSASFPRTGPKDSKQNQLPDRLQGE